MGLVEKMGAVNTRDGVDGEAIEEDNEVEDREESDEVGD